MPNIGDKEACRHEGCDQQMEWRHVAVVSSGFTGPDAVPDTEGPSQAWLCPDGHRSDEE